MNIDPIQKSSFWQYLRDNGVWILVGWSVVLIGFWIYWVASSSWEDSKVEIYWSGGISGVIMTVWVVGDYFWGYKKL